MISSGYDFDQQVEGKASFPNLQTKNVFSRPKGAKTSLKKCYHLIQMAKNKISQESFVEELSRCIEDLKEVVKCLEVEPKSSKEFRDSLEAKVGGRFVFKSLHFHDFRSTTPKQTTYFK